MEVLREAKTWIVDGDEAMLRPRRALATLSRVHPVAMAAPARAHSPPTPPNDAAEPPAKRARVASPPPVQASPVASTSALSYGTGLHLAPMVRIGTLPTRLLCAYLAGGREGRQLTHRTQQRSSTARSSCGGPRSLTRPLSAVLARWMVCHPYQKRLRHQLTRVNNSTHGHDQVRQEGPLDLRVPPAREVTRDLPARQRGPGPRRPGGQGRPGRRRWRRAQLRLPEAVLALRWHGGCAVESSR